MSAGRTSIGQTRSLRPEQHARGRQAGDQHQLARERHVHPQRALRALAASSYFRMPNWTMPIAALEGADADDDVDDASGCDSPRSSR